MRTPLRHRLVVWIDIWTRHQTMSRHATPQQRLGAAIGAALTMPVWWPVLMLLLSIMALFLLAIGIAALAAPAWIWLIGIPDQTHSELKVQVPLDQAPQTKKMLEEAGIRVIDERKTSVTA